MDKLRDRISEILQGDIQTLRFDYEYRDELERQFELLEFWDQQRLKELSKTLLDRIDKIFARDSIVTNWVVEYFDFENEPHSPQPIRRELSAGSQESTTVQLEVELYYYKGFLHKVLKSTHVALKKEIINDETKADDVIQKNDTGLEKAAEVKPNIISIDNRVTSNLDEENFKPIKGYLHTVAKCMNEVDMNILTNSLHQYFKTDSFPELSRSLTVIADFNKKELGWQINLIFRDRGIKPLPNSLYNFALKYISCFQGNSLKNIKIYFKSNIKNL